MSHHLYTTRLWFSRGKGIAKLRGKFTCIDTCPLGFEYVDYAPEAGTRIVRPEGGALRDMTDDEVKAVDAYLISMQEQMHA